MELFSVFSIYQFLNKESWTILYGDRERNDFFIFQETFLLIFEDQPVSTGNSVVCHSNLRGFNNHYEVFELWCFQSLLTTSMEQFNPKRTFFRLILTPWLRTLRMPLESQFRWRGGLRRSGPWGTRTWLSSTQSHKWLGKHFWKLKLKGFLGFLSLATYI